MKFSITASLFALLAVANAVAIEEPGMAAVRRDVLLLERQGVNANRPVANGACCIAATSLKQDVCNVNGKTGRCVPANVNNCKFLFFIILVASGQWGTKSMEC